MAEIAVNQIGAIDWLPGHRVPSTQAPGCRPAASLRNRAAVHSGKRLLLLHQKQSRLSHRRQITRGSHRAFWHTTGVTPLFSISTNVSRDLGAAARIAVRVHVECVPPAPRRHVQPARVRRSRRRGCRSGISGIPSPAHRLISSLRIPNPGVHAIHGLARRQLFLQPGPARL